MDDKLLPPQSGRKLSILNPVTSVKSGLWLLVIGLCLAAVAFIVGLIQTYRHSPAGQQQRNLATARAQGPSIESELKKDERFFDVKPFAYTGDGGVIGLSGSIYGGEAELQALKKTMEGMKLPLPVHYQIRVYELTEEEKKQVRGNGR